MSAKMIRAKAFSFFKTLGKEEWNGQIYEAGGRTCC